MGVGVLKSGFITFEWPAESVFKLLVGGGAGYLRDPDLVSWKV